VNCRGPWRKNDVIAGPDGYICTIGGVNAAGETLGTVEAYNPTYGNPAHRESEMRSPTGAVGRLLSFAARYQEYLAFFSICPSLALR
jgi:hypothetical protein